MTILKKLLLAVATMAVVVLPARAANYGTTDYTDLWYNPAESGWGINVIQQSNVMFDTLFVYGVDTAPNWFVASDIEPSPASSVTVFSGVLYKTTGPGYTATPFDPNAVRSTVVGTITFTFTGENTATLQYVINGTQYTKSIQRQTWRSESLAGTYYGGLNSAATACVGGAGNGHVVIAGDMTVSQTASPNQVKFAVSFIDSQGASQECDFMGPLVQAGSHGSVSGLWSCTTGDAGSFAMTSIQANPNGFTSVFHGTDPYCKYDGYFGASRGVPAS